MSTWLSQWEPENNEFWEKKGKSIAWKTLTITTIGLTFSFATWFVISAIVVRLPGIGFKFSQMELFWLAAMPGLSGGVLRFINYVSNPPLRDKACNYYHYIFKTHPNVMAD